MACIQVPPGVDLYIITGNIQKGRMMLPVLMCACGSTSLKRFHLHLTRFVPSTGAVNFKAYLLDGIARWNSACAAAAVQHPSKTLRTFNSRLQSKVNHLAEQDYPRRRDLQTLPATFTVHWRKVWGAVPVPADWEELQHQRKTTNIICSS